MKANEAIIPFFNKTPELVAGLNQLGMRNQAEVLFTSLLPGLNNVSNRVRYYSFYCWLIREFYKDREQVVESEFNQFIRRAEYLLALVHTKGEGVQGIPGITYALNKRHNSAEPYLLDEGIYNSAGKTDGTYWKNTGGVLRQYYSSSLKDISILGENNSNASILNISKEGDFIFGERLATVFQNSVCLNGHKFISLVKKGSVLSEELDQLYDAFNMRHFDSDEEKALIIDMLLQKDYPNREYRHESYRRSTIKYYLQYLKTHTSDKVSDIDFAKYMYNRFLGDNLSDACILGWYRYFLNEEWQYNSSELFCLLLYILSKDGNWYEVKQASELVSTKILESLCILPERKVKEVCAKLNDIVIPDSPKTIALAAKGFIGLLNRYVENCNIRERSADFSVLFPRSEPEDFFTLMDNIDACINMPIGKWLEKFIVKEIIHRHHEVSQRKYLQTGVASQKFIYEYGHIRFLKETETTHTAPRISTLNNFLSDLGIIVNDALTAEGEELLKRIEDEDRPI